MENINSRRLRFRSLQIYMDCTTLSNFNRFLFKLHNRFITRRAANDNIKSHFFIVVTCVLATIDILRENRSVQLEFFDRRESHRATRDIVRILAFIGAIQVHHIVIVRKATFSIFGQIDDSRQNKNRRFYVFITIPVRFIVFIFRFHRNLQLRCHRDIHRIAHIRTSRCRSSATGLIRKPFKFFVTDNEPCSLHSLNNFRLILQVVLALVFSQSRAVVHNDTALELQLLHFFNVTSRINKEVLFKTFHTAKHS